MDYVLDYDPLNWEDRYFLPGQSVDVLGLRAEGKPRLARKIDGLANVEPRAEARMVAARQGQHELARLLERLVYSYLKWFYYKLKAFVDLRRFGQGRPG